MLLQIIIGNKTMRSFHPIAVHPDNVLATCWVEPKDVFIEPKLDEYITFVTLKEKIVIAVDNNGDPVFSKQFMVNGHFQEISIALGLDTTGEIAEECFLREIE